jgi:hypothetical protein
MDESGLARKVIDVFADKPFEVIKHADRFRKGVPDFSVTGQSQTWWLEIKIIEDKWSGKYNIDVPFRARVMEDIVQFMTMRRLSKRSDGRAFYLAYDWDTKQFHVTKPEFFAPISEGRILSYSRVTTAIERTFLINLAQEHPHANG